MKRLSREPLVHFLVLGGLLFAVYGWINGRDLPETNVIRITEQEVDWLREVWTRQRQRAPSNRELADLAADYLKEQLLAREAIDLGLDENDLIVRRRLAQKLEFVVSNTARLAEPTEAALVQTYQTNRKRYVEPARITFTQIFFKTEAAAGRALTDMGSSNVAERGDSSLLAQEYSEVDQATVASLLGDGFAASVFAFEPGAWHGPVESVYGFHVVFLSSKTPARPLPFDAVRADVLEDWHSAREAKASNQFFADLLDKYVVVADEGVQSLLNPFMEKVQ